MRNNIEKLTGYIEKLLSEKERVIVAIDGNCGSGKTTLARAVSEHFSCPVIHTDDFFLRPEQRTEERLSEVGGNIDYERFKEEVTASLEKGVDFYYTPYDCGRGSLGEKILVKMERVIIVEGSYSLHPCFGKYYDFSVFLTAEKTIIHNRLRKRNERLFSRFINEWIPKENAYFEAFWVAKKADVIIDTTESGAL
ncbi:MAG: uridine kinase [Ruminiclostridium sp.]|nr:uridine kinase [Ruminiclostridium sp.]